MFLRTIIATVCLLLLSGCVTTASPALVGTAQPASPEAMEAIPSPLSTTLAIGDPVLATPVPPASINTVPIKPGADEMKDNADMKNMPGMKHDKPRTAETEPTTTQTDTKKGLHNQHGGQQ